MAQRSSGVLWGSELWADWLRLMSVWRLPVELPGGFGGANGGGFGGPFCSGFSLSLLVSFPDLSSF